MNVHPCLLYTPILRVDSVLRHPPTRAAMLVLDLEDSIPARDKERARRQLAGLDLTGAAGLPELGLRVNALSTRDGLRDLEALLDTGGRAGGRPVRTVFVPKAGTGAEVGVYRSLLAGLPEPPELCAFVETVDAVENAFDLAAASDGLCFGRADLLADLYAPNEAYLEHARARLCAAAARRDLPAIDTNSFELWDMDAVRAESDAARARGFTGKAAIHPRQVDPIADAFTVGAEELAGYRSTIEDYEQDARGFAVTKDRVLAPPFVAKARRMLRLHAAAAAAHDDPTPDRTTPAEAP